MAVPKAYSYTRMSTLEQLKGDSRRRQRDLAEAYAAKHGLQIEDRFDDWGVSAFKGKNSEFGALKVFKEKVEAGEIARGSYLIVESMDRLSRQPTMKALSILTGIVSSGIVLVTLDDDQVYSEETIEEHSYKLIIALGSMARSHEESRRKSSLVAAAWSEKKRKAREEQIVTTRKVPGWLTVVDGKIEAIPERVQIVREIFTLTRDGWGAYSVCRLLNDRRQPVWSTRKNAIWRESYIKKMIASRTTLGEYQPHRLVHSDDEGTKRVPDGAAILGYYPAAISQQLYSEANAATDRRRTSGRGRKGIRYANLFSGLLRCSCGAGYRYIDKGPPPKGGQYLQCSKAYLKGNCSVKPIRYEIFEQIMLSFVETLDVERVLGGDTINRRLNDKRSSIFAKSESRTVINAQIENLADAIASGGARKSNALLQRLQELEAKSEALTAEIEALDREINDLLQIDPHQRKVVIDGLLARIRDVGGAETVATRRALVGELQRMLEKVTITPNVRIGWEVRDSYPDWQQRYRVRSIAQLDKKCQELSFDITILYRNGDAMRIDALEGPYFRARGNKKMRDLIYVARDK